MGHDAELQRAVADAVRLVNTHPGQAGVRLEFRSAEFGQVDFVANAAQLEGNRFSFSAGFETYNGTIDELARIRAEVIRH